MIASSTIRCKSRVIAVAPTWTCQLTAQIISISIEKALLRLTALLSTDGAHVALAPYSGTIVWPGLTSRATMEDGGTQAANYLSQQNYIASAWLDVQTSTTHVDFFEVGSPPPPGVPLSVRVNWDDAFDSIVPNSGQQNGGVRDVGRLAAQGDDAKGKVLEEATNGAKGPDVALAVRKAHARAVAAAA